jgi:ribosomal-protein-alanine N-acetyltransferase
MEVKPDGPVAATVVRVKSQPRELQTERLVGRPPRPDDFDHLRLLHSDPRVTATLSADAKPFAPEATRKSLDAAARHWRRHGFGIRYFFEKGGDEFVGYCGLRHAVVDGRDEIELLYAVRADFWRRAYGVEMARAVIREGFDRLNFSNLVAFTLPTNIGSRGVMERCGMRCERDIVHAGLPHVLYRIFREDFGSL